MDKIMHEYNITKEYLYYNNKKYEAILEKAVIQINEKYRLPGTYYEKDKEKGVGNVITKEEYKKHCDE